MVFAADGTMRRRVRWFFTSPDAKVNPYQTPFRTNNYGDLAGPGIGPGEPWDAVVQYDQGLRSPVLDGTRLPCGPREWWEGGVPPNAAPLTVINGVPTCCGSPGLRASGGVMVGGGASIGCNPYSAIGQAFLTVPPYCTDLPAFQANNWKWFFTVPGGFCQVSSSAASRVGGGPACANLVMASSFNSLRFSECKYVGRLASDPAVAVYVGLDPINLRTLINWFLRFDRYGYRGEGGIKTKGITPGGVVRVPGQAGVMAGGVAFVPPQYHASGGMLAGGDGAPKSVYTSVGGVQLGATSAHRDRPHVSGGLAAGGASQLHVRHPVAGGSQPGGASALHVRLTGTAGIKAGGASGTNAGHVVAACPTTAIATTLHGIGSLGTAFTATWSAAVSGWTFTDPDSGLAWRLENWLNGATNEFRSFTAQPHCGASFVQISKVCGHPFSCSTRTTLSGVSCLAAGTYDFSFSE